MFCSAAAHFLNKYSTVVIAHTVGKFGKDFHLEVRRIIKN